jgi:hypothetical protein
MLAMGSSPHIEQATQRRKIAKNGEASFARLTATAEEATRKA